MFRWRGFASTIAHQLRYVTFDVKGKNALVTGGATGIGLAYVKELLRNGVAAVGVADLDDRKGENSVKELNTEFGSGKAIFIKCDVTNTDELTGAFQKAAQTFKGLDIVINNAGILDDSRWELEIAINVTAVARGTWLAFDIMGKGKGGRGGVVANIASILGLQAMAGCPVYVATKHAVVGLSRSFGMPYHFDRTGVKVVTMCPVVTDTPLISEAHHRQFTDDLGTECGRELDSLPKQQPENVAKGMLHIIRNGSNGSVWVSEGGHPRARDHPRGQLGGNAAATQRRLHARSCTTAAPAPPQSTVYSLPAVISFDTK